MDSSLRIDAEPARGAYDLLADLPFAVSSYDVEQLALDVSSGFRRVTTIVRLRGGGFEGRGEDVTYAAEDHDDYPAGLPLTGGWTLDDFSARLGDLDLFPGRPPQEEFFRPYRRWAFESAALDPALRSSGLSLGAALGRPYRPLRFAVSTRLDIMPWLEVDPGLEFKLDPTPEWDLDLMRRIAATDRVRVVDFKSFYAGSPVDNPPDPVQYRDAAVTFRGAVLEDPALDGPAREALRGEEARFSFDAPVHSWQDVEELTARVWEKAPREAAMPSDDASGAGETPADSPPPALRHLNIKPSRFGSVHGLLECIERAQAAGTELYGGGQFELSVGRDHIQALASLFYPDGPNDVAPREYHGAAHADVPGSPLVPVPGLDTAAGFGFAFRR
jgi:hypothetical protein